MREFIVVAVIIAFIALVLFFESKQQTNAAIEQCHGHEQFFAYAGKLYPCPNYRGISK